MPNAVEFSQNSSTKRLTRSVYVSPSTSSSFPGKNKAVKVILSENWSDKPEQKYSISKLTSIFNGAGVQTVTKEQWIEFKASSRKATPDQIKRIRELKERTKKSVLNVECGEE